MDRTNWKYGKRHLNILTVGVVVNKVAIPIAWIVLPQKTKRGNSNTKQRIKIFKKVLQIMGPEDIFVLTMDREFGGKEWLKWLGQKGVGFVVRIKKNIIVGQKSADEYPMSSSAKKAKNRHTVWTLELFFAQKIIRSKGRRDDRLFVLSNRFNGDEALELYKLRWGIEQLFSHLKKRGFNLEDTRIVDGAKLEKLFAIVSLAFLYSFAWGCHLRSTRKTSQAMKRKSIFRQGLEDILRLLNNPYLKKGEKKNFIDWLKSPFQLSISVV